MAELRWHPLTKDWIMIASHRQGRPQMPKDWCPFCPGSGNVPEEYDVLKYNNDFPALSQNPPVPDDIANDFFKTADSYGKCEVILYSSNHTITVPELPVDHLKKLVDLWGERFEELRKDEKIKYIFIFENRGEAVGVTMPHPHGQIYGYPFIPKKVELEIDSSKEYYQEHGKSLFADWLENEVNAGDRIIFKNEHFTVFLPYFCEYPYGIYIMANSQKQYITEFNEEERIALAKTLKEASGTLDSLFNMQFPYMMCMYNAPVNSEDYSKEFRFHIAFYPPMRSADKIKFNASSETGAWAHCNPTCPEDTAKELQDAYARFMEKCGE